MHLLAELLHCPCVGNRIEVADQKESIGWLRLGGNHSHQLVCCSLQTAETAAVHRRRPMVVCEEDGLPCALAAEARPLHTSVAIPLMSHVLGHMLSARAQQLPLNTPEGDG